MKKDDMYNGSNSTTPNNNKRSSISSNKTSSFKMIDIDVKQARKDVDSIFSYTSKRLNENSKQFRKESKTLFDEVSKQSEEFFDRMESRINDIFNNSENINNFSNNMSDATQKSADNMRSQYNKVFKDIDDAHKRSIDNRKAREEEYLRSIVQGAKDSYDNINNMSIRSKENKNTSTEDESGKDFTKNLKNGIITAIVEGGKELISIWGDRFEQGIQRIVTTYENTYHEVSLMTGLNQSTYKSFQDETLSFLRDNNLDNVIRISDVMNEMRNAVVSGITDAGDAQNIALQNSITKAINPFIDTQSDAYQDLQISLGQKFIDGTNGIVEAVNQNVGQTRFVSKNLNNMLEAFEPVLQNARDENMSNQLADLAASLEAEVKSGRITSDEAQNRLAYAENSMKQYDILQNGSVAEIASLTKTLDEMNRLGIKNNEENAIKVGSMMSDNMGEFNEYYSKLNKGNLLGGSILNTELGTNIFAYDTSKQVENTGNTSVEDAQKSLIENISDTFTSLYKKESTAENMMTGVAQFQQTYPDAYKILQKMVGLLTTIAISPFIKDGFSSLIKNGKNSGLFDNAKALGQMFKEDVAKDGLRNTATTYAKTFGPELLNTIKTGIGQSGLANGAMSATGTAGTIAKLATGASALVGIGMSLKDAVGGFKKSTEWFGENADIGDKMSSTIGGILGGTGKGIGQDGATAGGVAKNTLGNTAKGAAIGFAVGGPLGAAIGGGAGALLGLIGGERIAKAADTLGEALADGVKTTLEANPITNIMGKQFNAIKDNFKQTTSEIGELWNDEDKSLADKIGGTFGYLKQGFKDTQKELIESIGKGIEDSFVGKGYEAIKNFGSKITDEFKKFKTDPVKYITEGFNKSKEKVTEFAKSVGEKISSIWDSTKKFFSDMSESAKEAEKQAKKTDQKDDKKESSGSHASGLNYVPYDGYNAKLHRGETIFNKEASKQIANVLGIFGTSTKKLDSSVVSQNSAKIIAIPYQSSIEKGLLSNDSNNKNMLDTSNLESAIYAIGDKIVKAIESNSKSSSNNDIVDTKTGTVNVKFVQGNNDFSLAPTLLG